ncbi:tyrosine-type recombinase/integrase [Litorilinea aerophila]|uniref:Tyrosine-type recombinase/integrase n=1 Tax=Litorilinea aerophila TaxID=1204385 RepID=A0A540V8Y1_9CHLR|nr:tyrosine-type recombinase/integrase [Litorilinea aerophila]
MSDKRNEQLIPYANNLWMEQRPGNLQGSESPLPFAATILAGQLAPSSIAMYQRDFEAYLRFAGSFDQAVDAATLARWRSHLAQSTDMSPNTINRMLSAVKRLMKEAAAQGYIGQEVALSFAQVSGVKAAALKDRIKQNARTRIEPEAMRDICELPDTSQLIGLRDSAILATLASGGLRVSELASLKCSQIRRKGRGYVVLVRGKNDVEFREAPLSREAHTRIAAWLAARPVDSEYVFTAFDGRGNDGKRLSDRPLSAVALWRIVRKYSLQAGMEEVKPHDFRRFVGTQLARKDIRMAQKALGHKRLETTVRHYVLDELEPGLTDDLY